MKPIDQSIIHGNGLAGDCLRACVASIFEIPIEEIPHFCDRHLDEKITNENHCFTRINKWLSEKFGMSYLEVEFGNFGTYLIEKYGGYYIATGPTDRFNGDVLHCVIYNGDKMIHDPHPSKSGLKTVYNIGIFILNDPVNYTSKIGMCQPASLGEEDGTFPENR